MPRDEDLAAAPSWVRVLADILAQAHLAGATRDPAPAAPEPARVVMTIGSQATWVRLDDVLTTTVKGYALAAHVDVRFAEGP